MKLALVLLAIGLTPGDMALRHQQYLNVGETCSYSTVEFAINEAFKVVQTINNSAFIDNDLQQNYLEQVHV